MVKREIAGLEEAGRGPLIGPLVIAIAIIDESKIDELKKINVKDSKKLSTKQRNSIFKKLKNIVSFKLKITYPEEIDRELRNQLSNLNLLEAKKMAELINETGIKNVIIDCPSNNIKKFINYLKNHLEDKDVKILAEHKADENYLIVAAASIIAKVVRDKEIQKIKKITKEDFGSGYPSDPKTQEFLKKYYKQFPQFFRRSWITYKKVLEKKKQKKISEFF